MQPVEIAIENEQQGYLSTPIQESEWVKRIDEYLDKCLKEEAEYKGILDKIIDKEISKNY